MLFVSALADYYQYYKSGHWWDSNYCATLIIPFLLMPTFVCLMFVPRRIEWSEIEFKIQTRFGQTRMFPWEQLYAYGSGKGVFLLKFDDVSTFQIYAAAFNSGQWQQFKTFLDRNHPDKEASYWIGTKPIKRD